jgi:metal-responsive CopG/Arc/MetJ family transcriptional regulator
VAVNLPPEILARVDELAAATGGTRSETIRVLVTDMIGALFTDPED